MGEAHGFEIFDIHQHMGSTADAHGFATEGAVVSGANAQELAARLKFMDRAGIGATVAIPGHNYNRSAGVASTAAENDAIAAYRDATPGRFPVAVGVIEPLDQAAAVQEVVRIHQELGLKGVSFHTEFQGVTIDSPWMMKILEKMFDLKMVPLIHTSNVVLHEALWRLGKVARAFPGETIVALEPFFTFDGMQECFFIADVAPNVLFDTASCFHTDLAIELARQFGAERIVYGSQYYSQLKPNERAFVKNAVVRDDIIATERLSREQKQLILAGNTKRVFGL